MISTPDSKAIRTVAVEKNTWILEVPEDVCEREGFAAGTLASLTIKDGAISASFIPRKLSSKIAAADFISRYREFMSEIADVD
ncbi:MAG: hypothetical protein JNL64_14215 [Blastocatellia bacterium]|jgi:hypothetical protein|nr:hypothetical protein [Blastocatellia bacterium]